ncbi:MarP family serine protease [Phycicoccus flavus]|uniref:MarP family serine protease n=1 Tax=Phycicoccus flavus TaxID=2502783 RepID=A0A8T6R8P2_9MICO|nr:MarP family serine protease [Phycicoccus flavus]NHA69770.1 MarP family serine protease [Phycicoccus flavus]
MSGSTVLDIVLVLVLLGYAGSGWRQGFVAALLGLVGLVAGAWAALRFGPPLLRAATDIDLSTPVGTLVLVALTLVVATIGQGVMLALASRLRGRIRSSSLRVVDSAVGAVAVLVVAVLVVWVLAGALRTSGPASLRPVLARSAVVQEIDRLVPSSAQGVVDEATQALGRTDFPRVFEGLGPEPIASVPAPDGRLARDPAVRRALGSVIHVRAEAPRCGQTQVGSGWVLSQGRVVTNAHVVSGASRVQVDVGGRGPELDAQVVAFDADRDIAVLLVPGLTANRLPQGEELGRGDDAVLAGFPGDEGLWVGSARVRSVLEARGADIYGDPGTTRRIYSLRATIRQGASGGPVLDADGDVVGMVFATSLDDPDTGYALTLEEMAPVLDTARRANAPVPTGACATH